MTTLLVATTNGDKLREIAAVLGDRVRLLGLADGPSVPEPEETGQTFAENARLKALYYDAHVGEALRRQTPGVLTVAEDSGLSVDALNGAPGVYSARYRGADATYAERFEALAAELRGVPEEARTGRFVCAVAVVDRGSVLYETQGEVHGRIVPPAGTAGFGYDPIFHYPPYGRTLAEVTREEKLRVAHRGVAFRALAEWLDQRT